MVTTKKLLRFLAKSFIQANIHFQIALIIVPIAAIGLAIIGDWMAALWAANTELWIFTNVLSEQKIQELENKIGQMTLTDYEQKN